MNNKYKMKTFLNMYTKFSHLKRFFRLTDFFSIVFNYLAREREKKR